jgi:hypothetical protein
MVAALLVAVAFAIGHDAFYQSLDRRPVLNTGSLIPFTSSLRVSDQQMYVSIGTFFAFIVKCLLGISASTVFDQFFWKSIHGQATQIGVIDDLLSTLKNGFMTLNLALWKRYPISMTLAMVCWLLPIASIITPATLSVDSVSFDKFVARRVPRIDFASTNFANLGSGLSVNTNFDDDDDLTPDSIQVQPVVDQYHMYSGPMPEVQRITAGAATQGAISSIEPPSTNSSWTLEFHGPALVCDKVDQKLANYITQDVERVINASRISSFEYEGLQYLEATVYGYLSWTPGVNNSVEESLPFYRRDVNDTYALRTASLGPVTDGVINIGGTSSSFSTPQKPLGDGASLSLYFATFPHMVDYDIALENVHLTARDPTIVRCVLHNASYQTNYTYINGDQSIHVTDQNILNPMGYLAGVDSNLANSSLFHDSEVMEALSYQSIMEAFGSLLIGSISEYIQIENINGHAGAQNETDPHTSNTSVISTALMETKELQVIQSFLRLKTEDAYMNYWHAKSMTSSNYSSRPLSRALEEMFQNVTISFMGSGLFQYASQHSASAIGILKFFLQA